MTQSISITDYMHSLEKKYRQYINNLQWHIDTNKPTGVELEITQRRIKDFQEIVNDLSI